MPFAHQTCTVRMVLHTTLLLPQGSMPKKELQPTCKVILWMASFPAPCCHAVVCARRWALACMQFQARGDHYRAAALLTLHTPYIHKLCCGWSHDCVIIRWLHCCSCCRWMLSSKWQLITIVCSPFPLVSVTNGLQVTRWDWYLPGNLCSLSSALATLLLSATLTHTE